jgi:hypothetical protein
LTRLHITGTGCLEDPASGSPDLFQVLGHGGRLAQRATAYDARTTGDGTATDQEAEGMSVRPLGLWMWRISMRARHGLGAGAVTFALFVLATASAAAAINPGHGVTGLKLGDTTARVRAVLGKPATIQHNHGGEQNWLYGKGPVDWVTIISKRGHATVEGIETSDPKQKTSRGVGVGSSLGALRKAYPNVTCKKGWLGVPFTSCWILTSGAHQRIPTNFVLFKRKVGTVDVGQIGERNLAPQP